MECINELRDSLNVHLGWNKARITCFVNMLLALLTTRNDQNWLNSRIKDYGVFDGFFIQSTQRHSPPIPPIQFFENVALFF